jgi:hypothetical protein
VRCLALFSPFLVYDAPVSAIVLAFEEGERLKQVEQLSGRLAVFAYDADGNYRWQGCSFPHDFIGENGPRVTRLPDPANSTNWKKDPSDVYWADYQVLSCHRAKAGDSYFQAGLFRRFNETVFDPVYTYYWARIAGENSHRGNSRYLQGVESSLPPEALKAGERYFRSHPLDTVDCREVADMLVEAKNSGSEGPNFKIARPSLGPAEPTKAAMSGIFDCPLAKAGDIGAQWSIFRMVNAMVPDPIETYNWARVVKDNPKGWSYTYERIQRTLPIVTVEAGEKYYLTHPLELIDCASLWSTLAKAQEAGSEGPKLGGNRSAYSVL